MLTYFGAVVCTPLSEQPRHDQHQGPDGHDANSEKQIPFAYQWPAKFGTHLLSPHAVVTRLQLTFHTHAEVVRLIQRVKASAP